MADEEDESESPPPPPPPISTGEVELTFQQSSIVHPEAASTNRDAQIQTRQRTPPRRLEIPPPPPPPSPAQAQGFYPSTQASLGASRHNIIRTQIQIQSQRQSSSWNTQRRWESHSLSSFQSEMQVESQMPTNQDNIAHAEFVAGPSNGHLPNAAESSEDDNAPVLSVDDHTTLGNGNAQHPFSASTSQNSTDDED